MDFMKVIDQTVRDIKREVNLKVLKVPEIEQKVLDATDNEPWGPHGTALAEIAQATRKFTDCQMVMNVLWTRFGETGKDWRCVYKALAVIEYLIANGSERALEDIKEHTFQISSYTAFEFVEPNGKDMGINVRKKAENIVALLNSSDKIQETRNKAAATREKYVGLSSSGATYKSSSASCSGSNFQSSSSYGGFSSRYDSDRYKSKDEDQFQEENFEKYVPKTQKGSSAERKAKRPGRDRDHPYSGSPKPPPKNEYNDKSHETTIIRLNSQIDDDDDFDPRGTTSSEAAGSQLTDLFGDSLIGHFANVDAPTSIAPQSIAENKSFDIDLFADADFLSAAPQVEAGRNSLTQPNIDLIATEAAASAAVSSPMDFFSSSDPAMLPETKSDSNGPSKVNTENPFAAVQLGNFDGSHLIGAFTTQPTQSSQTSQILLNNSSMNDLGGKSFLEYKAPLKEDIFQVTQNPVNNNAMIDLHSKSSPDHRAPPKKDTFQVKSGIWADSLNRGLIDLNITAPKKVNLAEIGIIGGLSDGLEQKPKAASTSYSMSTSPGMAAMFSRSSSVTSTGSSGDAYFSSLSSSQYFEK